MRTVLVPTLLVPTLLVPTLLALTVALPSACGPRAPSDAGAGHEGCVSDDECAGDPCLARRCVGGVCIGVAPLIDADADGHAPPPCGGDCDERDARVHPDAPELCDAVDQDCDGLVDEDAAPRAMPRVVDDLARASLSALGQGFLAIGLRANGIPVALRLSTAGEPGERVELDDRPWEAIAAARDGTRLLVAGARGGVVWGALDASLRWSEGPIVLDPEAPLALAATELSREAWLAWDVRAADGSARRSLWHAGRRDELAAGEVLALAHDATQIAITTDDGVELRDRSGRIERVAIAGAVAALAGGPSRIFVAWADGFDHSLGWLGGGPAVSAPFGQGPPELAAVGDRLLVVRQQGGEVRGWLLAPDLRSYAATYEAGALGSAHEAERASTAIATDGTMAMLRSGSDGTTLIVLSCP